MKTFFHLSGAFLIMACLGSCTYHPASAQEAAPAGKTYPKIPEFDKLKRVSLAEIMNELEARGAIPQRTSRRGPLQRNPALANASTRLLRSKAIIDSDNRKEIFAIPDPKEKGNADTVLGIFKKSQLEKSGNTWRLKGDNGVFDHMIGYPDRPLCKDTRFKGQPLGPFGTAVTVRKNIIATVDHNIKDKDPNGLIFIFGFRMNRDNTPVTYFPSNDVYFCEEIIPSKLVPELYLIKLKGEIPQSRIARVTSENIDNGGVYNIGHPLGLPAKHADNAKIRRSDENSFWADIDAFRGNSGSPVFLKNKDVVVGILVDTYDNEEYCYGEGGQPPNCCEPNVRLSEDARMERCLKINDKLISQELDGRLP